MNLLRSPYPGALPAVVGASYAYYNSQSSQTLTLPTGWAAGDLMVITTIMIGEQGYPTAASVSGWTLYQTYLGGGSAPSRITVYTKTAASGQGNVTIAFSSSGYRQVILSMYRNVTGIQSYVFAEDTASPYTTDTLSSVTSPAIVAIVASGAKFESGTAYDPGSVTINNGDHLTQYGTGRGAITHISADASGSYGAYPLVWVNSISRARSVLLEIR